MKILLVVIAVIALVVVALLISRAGASRHQESLNTHDGDPEGEPRRDRPAGPGAEAMGVDGPGQPGLGPDG